MVLGWSGQQGQEHITPVVVLVVVIHKEVHTQQALVVLVAAAMAAILLSSQQAVTQHLTRVEVVVLETIITVMQKAEKVVRAS